jgi:hypothetical protein
MLSTTGTKVNWVIRNNHQGSANTNHTNVTNSNEKANLQLKEQRQEQIKSKIRNFNDNTNSVLSFNSLSTSSQINKPFKNVKYFNGFNLIASNQRAPSKIIQSTFEPSSTDSTMIPNSYSTMTAHVSNINSKEVCIPPIIASPTHRKTIRPFQSIISKKQKHRDIENSLISKSIQSICSSSSSSILDFNKQEDRLVNNKYYYYLKESELPQQNSKIQNVSSSSLTNRVEQGNELQSQSFISINKADQTINQAANRMQINNDQLIDLKNVRNIVRKLNKSSFSNSNRKQVTTANLIDEQAFLKPLNIKTIMTPDLNNSTNDMLMLKKPQISSKEYLNKIYQVYNRNPRMNKKYINLESFFQSQPSQQQPINYRLTNSNDQSGVSQSQFEENRENLSNFPRIIPKDSRSNLVMDRAKTEFFAMNLNNTFNQINRQHLVKQPLINQLNEKFSPSSSYNKSDSLIKLDQNEPKENASNKLIASINGSRVFHSASSSSTLKSINRLGKISFQTKSESSVISAGAGEDEEEEEEDESNVLENTTANSGLVSTSSYLSLLKKRVSFHEQVIETDVDSGNITFKPITNFKNFN